MGNMELKPSRVDNDELEEEESDKIILFHDYTDTKKLSNIDIMLSRLYHIRVNIKSIIERH